MFEYIASRALCCFTTSTSPQTSKTLSGEFFGKIETLLAPAAVDGDVSPPAGMVSVNRDQAGGPRFNSLYVGIAALGALAGAAAIYFCVT